MWPRGPLPGDVVRQGRERKAVRPERKTPGCHGQTTSSGAHIAQKTRQIHVTTHREFSKVTGYNVITSKSTECLYM